MFNFAAVCKSSLRSHHGDELLVIDLTVPVNIGLPDHLVHFLVSQLLPKVGHDVPQLGSGDESVTVLVEHSESLADFFLAVGVFPLPLIKQAAY